MTPANVNDEAMAIPMLEAMEVESLLAGGADPTHGSRLGQLRYVVERTLSHFGNFRRLKVRYERTKQSFQAFHHLAASPRVFNRVRGCEE